MALLGGTNVNYNDVPDVNPPLPAAIYRFKIEKAVVEDNKAKNGKNLVLDLRVPDDCQREDARKRKIKMYSSTDNDVQIRRIFLSSQTPFNPDGSADTDHLVGKQMVAEIESGTYTDPKTNITRETGNVKSVVIPTDGTYASAL